MTINTNALKTYAPRARKDFIAAMITRAAKFGITEKEITEQREQGDVVIVGADALPKKVGEQRKKLVGRIKKHGFEQAMEAVAYTWFNRLVAIRYMELHGLLDHGYRVLSHPSDKELPEVLEHAEHLDFPGLDKSKVIDLKLDGTKDAELYRILLIAQCNALHRAMPFLFERIDDETELLLPDNLLHSDSLIRKLVVSIDEADWEDIEVIGWLYQFYISEKKDEVFAGLKKNQKITADKIPAATQLFTPHWIVRYLVENSLGRLWLLNRPDSRLAEQMDYYIAPEEPETDFLKIGKPEEIKVCDPACGSGHMLTYAFDLLYAIYEEEGYDPKEIPALILKHNLTGTEIDDRAGALAAFALSMKAADKLGRRRFQRMEVKPDIVVLQDVAFTPEEMTDVQAVVGRDLFTDELRETLLQFENAKNCGSLIVPELRDPQETLRVVEARDFSSDLLLKEVQDRVSAVLRMAEALSPKYQVVVANPPYMGGGGMNGVLANWLKVHFPATKSDLFSAFVERLLGIVKKKGFCGIVTPFTWLYISTFKKLRHLVLTRSHVQSFVKPSYTAFYESAIVPLMALVLRQGKDLDFRGKYYDLGYLGSGDQQPGLFLGKINSNDYVERSASQFLSLEGNEMAYNLPDGLVQRIESRKKLGDICSISEGLKTGQNELFIRFWQEVSRENTGGFGNEKKWVPHAKGGDFRRWYGNLSWVVNWGDSGEEMRATGKAGFQGKPNYGAEGAVWSKISTSYFSVRFQPLGCTFDSACPGLFAKELLTPYETTALLCSTVGQTFIKSLNPTMNFQVGNISAMPLPENLAWHDEITRVSRSAVELSKSDWDAYEASWDFTTLPLFSSGHHRNTLEATYSTVRAHWKEMTNEMQRLEEENNRIFIDAYGLQDELTPNVPIEEITLTCNPAYRYGVKGTEEEREERLRSDTMKELISYAIGCMMGRYSLAEPGLIYANAGNEGFDASRYGDFPADDDGIVPVTEVEWFDDDAALRFEEFLKVAWSPDSLRENLRFVAEGLATNGGNDPQKTIRNYISKSFFKDHMQTYKKRPIFWLFSSGKLRAFECLVYLHRYNEGTLSRMRMEYVTPLTSRMAARIDQLEDDITNASSSAARTKTQKEKDLMVKQLDELRAFDEELRHYADQRITLDLDDGVKVNYGKFGSLLAERKAITGEK